MKYLLTTLWFVLLLNTPVGAGVLKTEYITEKVCHSISGCWLNPKTGECPDCVTETRKIVTEIKEPFVEPKKVVKVEKPKKEKVIKKKGNWTCIVGPCDFIDEDGNLIEKS
jgi:hypothetical protein